MHATTMHRARSHMHPPGNCSGVVTEPVIQDDVEAAPIQTTTYPPTPSPSIFYHASQSSIWTDCQRHLVVLRRHRCTRWVVVNWPLAMCMLLVTTFVWLWLQALWVAPVSYSDAVPHRAVSSQADLESLREVARQSGLTCMHARQVGIDRRNAVMGAHVGSEFEVAAVADSQQVFISFPSIRCPGQIEKGYLYKDVRLTLMPADPPLLLSNEAAFCAQRMAMINEGTSLPCEAQRVGI